MIEFIRFRDEKKNIFFDLFLCFCFRQKQKSFVRRVKKSFSISEEMKISAEDVDISQEKFSRALSIYLRKIHVVNKRVTTVRFASFLERSDRRYFNGRNQIDRRCLIAKNKEVFSDQDEIVLTEEFSAEFLPVVEENFSKKSCSVQCSSYRIEYFPTDKRLEMTIENEANPKQTIWLRDVLFEKFLLWTKSVLTNPEEQSTLKLIPVETYQNEYQRLKNKYGKFLTENWKESTDPQKHVFEDLGKQTKTEFYRNSRRTKDFLYQSLFRHRQLPSRLLSKLF